MKYFPLLIALFVLASCSNKQATHSYDEIPWMTLTEVDKVVKKSPRMVMVDVYTPWCGPCKMMNNSTFKDPELVNYIGKNFYAVKFNAEGPDPITFNGKEYANPKFRTDIPKNRRNQMHQFTGTLGVRGYPTIVIFDTKLNKVNSAVGYRSAPQLLEFLKGLETS